MAKKRVTRKELLKKEDEFVSLSARIYQYVVEHRARIQWAAISLAAILVIILGVSLYFRHLNQKALAAYNMAYKSLVSDTSSQAAEESIQRSTEELDRLIREYGWTKVATLAIPQLAYLKFGQGNYEEAITLYETFLEKVKTGSIYQPMAYFGLAACYEAKGDHQSAIRYLNKIIENDASFLKEEAMFSLGRVYELSGRRELSKDTFRSFVSLFPQSPLLPLAKAHLRNGS
ncbi:MAG: tetratricopeptide repeat protein [Deltaproteobacteria bacterium]|nr:tetratricopeptide repeat protein [Deltaproteobacteria bacterium]